MIQDFIERCGWFSIFCGCALSLYRETVVRYRNWINSPKYRYMYE